MDEPLVEKGNAAYKVGDYEGAVELYTTAMVSGTEVNDDIGILHNHTQYKHDVL